MNGFDLVFFFSLWICPLLNLVLPPSSSYKEERRQLDIERCERATIKWGKKQIHFKADKTSQSPYTYIQTFSIHSLTLWMRIVEQLIGRQKKNTPTVSCSMCKHLTIFGLNENKKINVTFQDIYFATAAVTLITNGKARTTHTHTASNSMYYVQI